MSLKILFRLFFFTVNQKLSNIVFLGLLGGLIDLLSVYLLNINYTNSQFPEVKFILLLSIAYFFIRLQINNLYHLCASKRVNYLSKEWINKIIEYDTQIESQLIWADIKTIYTKGLMILQTVFYPSIYKIIQGISVFLLLFLYLVHICGFKIFIYLLFFIAIISFYWFLTKKSLKKFSKLENRNYKLSLDRVEEVTSDIANSHSIIKSNSYFKYFGTSDFQYRRSMSINQSIAEIPKTIYESIIILALLIPILITSNSFIPKFLLLDNVPPFASLAFILLRILASVQLIYSSINFLYGWRSTFYDVYSFLDFSREIRTTPKKASKVDSTIPSQKVIEYIHIKKINLPTNNFKNSIYLKKGDVLIIKGPSGCGKTTLLKALSGLINSSCEIEIKYEKNQKILINKTKKLKNHFSLLPQKPLLIKSNLIDNITLFNQKYDKNLYEKAIYYSCSENIKTIPTSNNIDERNFDLSGGQSQRISLGRYIYNNKSNVMLLDEPTSSLDDALSEKLIKRLLKYNEDKILIVVTHNINIKLINNFLKKENRNSSKILNFEN